MSLHLGLCVAQVFLQLEHFLSSPFQLLLQLCVFVFNNCILYFHLLKFRPYLLKLVLIVVHLLLMRPLRIKRHLFHFLEFPFELITFLLQSVNCAVLGYKKAKSKELSKRLSETANTPSRCLFNTAPRCQQAERKMDAESYIIVFKVNCFVLNPVGIVYLSNWRAFPLIIVQGC